MELLSSLAHQVFDQFAMRAFPENTKLDNSWFEAAIYFAMKLGFCVLLSCCPLPIVVLIITPVLTVIVKLLYKNKNEKQGVVKYVANNHHHKKHATSL